MKIRFSGLPLSIFLCLLLLAPAPAKASEQQPIELADTAIYVSDSNALIQMLNEAESLMAREPENIDAQRHAGIAAHQLSLFGKEDYADKAIKYLGNVVEKKPDDAVARAYLGSSYALLARESSVIMQRVSNVNKGLSILNRAVRMAPKDFVVRMVRGSVIFELPAMFKQLDMGIEDFSYVESRFADLPPGYDSLKAEVYYKLGLMLAEKGDGGAKAGYMKKAVEAAPGSKWAGLAKKE